MCDRRYRPRTPCTTHAALEVSETAAIDLRLVPPPRARRQFLRRGDELKTDHACHEPLDGKPGYTRDERRTSTALRERSLTRGRGLPEFVCECDRRHVGLGRRSACGPTHQADAAVPLEGLPIMDYRERLDERITSSTATASPQLLRFQWGGRRPASVTSTSRRTALLEGRPPAAVRAWTQ